MSLIVLAISLYAGLLAKQLSYKPFLVLLIVAIAGSALAAMTKGPALEQLGEVNNLWSFDVFASNVALNLVFFSLFYLLGFGIGHWKRQRGKKATGDRQS